MLIDIMDYRNITDTIEVPDDWENLYISVYAGDEIVSVAPIHWSNYAMSYDGSYVLPRKFYDQWANRKDSYQWLWGWPPSKDESDEDEAGRKEEDSDD